MSYRSITSQNAEKLASFDQQMADFARGRRLLELRDARHLSQEDAAHEIGTTAKSLRAWEHGGKIRWENAERVAEFYGVDPEQLVSREPVTAEGERQNNGTTPSAELDRIDAALSEAYAALRALRASQAPSAPAADAEPAKRAKAAAKRAVPKRSARKQGTRGKRPAKDPPAVS